MQIRNSWAVLGPKTLFARPWSANKGDEGKMNLFWTCVTIVILLGVSAFFSMAETALTSVSRAKMRIMAQEGNWPAQIVTNLLDQQDRLIGTLLLGNNLINILASAITTEFMLDAFGKTGIAYATGIMTILVLVFAEVLPKSYALNQADKVSLAIAPFVRVLYWALFPPMYVVSWVVRRLAKFMGADLNRVNYAISATELRGAIEMHLGEDHADKHDVKHERVMLRSILDLGETTIEKVMTHRKTMEVLNAGGSIDELIDQAMISAYTRIPLYQDKPENIVGILHTKLLIKQIRANQGNKSNVDITAAVSEPWFVPETTTLFDQLQAFRNRREHIALVVDEYGALLGLVTREDIIEEIVGQMDESHEVEGVSPNVKQDYFNNGYIVDGATTIRELNREFEWNLPDDEYATVAGLVLYESQIVPQVGQSFTFFDFRFDVLARQRHQITSVRITPLKPEKPNVLSASLQDKV
jgi:Mg2+/Co2+ transporter CorB